EHRTVISVARDRERQGHPFRDRQGGARRVPARRLRGAGGGRRGRPRGPRREHRRPQGNEGRGGHNTPRLHPHRRAGNAPDVLPAAQRGPQRAAPRRVRGADGGHRHRHRPAGPQAHDARGPRKGRGDTARQRAGAPGALRERPAPQGLPARDPGGRSGTQPHREPAQRGAPQGALPAGGARDLRRARRDTGRRPRGRPPLEGGRLVQRAGRGPGGRLRRAAGEPRPRGCLRAQEREDRHYPVGPRARAVYRQGALAGEGARGLPGRGREAGRGDRAGRPALAGDRPRGPERPPRGEV
ncbi:MAG: Transcription termination protein NusA, partial [uncultured Rubrobacteraceae bacterium]